MFTLKYTQYGAAKTMVVPQEHIDALAEVRKRVSSPWSFCDFAGPYLNIQKRQSEAEYLVCETLFAAVVNSQAGNGPITFADRHAMHGFEGGGIVDNGTAFTALVTNKFFEVLLVHRDDLVTQPNDNEPNAEGFYTCLYPTPKLVTAVQKFLAAEAKAA